MIIGPSQIIACPKCQGLASYVTLLSGNSIGSWVWTDGKVFAPMHPRPPAVVSCVHCGECYWRAAAKRVVTINWYDCDGQRIDPAWRAAKDVCEPTEEEYYQAIAKGLATDLKQERSLRILAWWRRNDAFRILGKLEKAARAPAQCKPSPPLPWRENLAALLPLLDEGNNNDCLMKAEVLRELGDFEAAKQVLNRMDLEKTEKVAEFIRLLKAEELRKLLREMGDLESVNQVRSHVKSMKPTARLAENIRLIQSLCDSADSGVRELSYSA